MISRLNDLVQDHFWPILSGVIVIGVVAVSVVWFWPRGQTDPSPTVELPSYPFELVALGRDIYQSNCQICHGPDGGGNPAAGIPALDGSMHSWHHPDSQIAGFIRRGVGNMPAVGPEWTDREILAVLAYIKQWWEPDQLEYQTRVSEQNP